MRDQEEGEVEGCAMTPQDAEKLDLESLSQESLVELVRVLRLMLNVARAEGTVLAERVRRLEEARKQDREQEDYRPRRENW